MRDELRSKCKETKFQKLFYYQRILQSSWEVKAIHKSFLDYFLRRGRPPDFTTEQAE